MGILLRFAALFALFTVFPLRADLGDEVYGKDDRKDVCNVKDRKHRAVLKSVAAIVDRSSLEGSFRERTVYTPEPAPTLRESIGLCPGERFGDQPTWADCSSFLIGSDLMATAGHCITGQKRCDEIAIVFGYEKGSDGIPSAYDNVYFCTEILVSKNKKTDFAIFRIDRQVRGRNVLELRQDGEPAPGDSVFMAGYPSGLPLKVTDGAVVQKIDEENVYATLDTFGGNSGSPVIGYDSGLVEGILVAALDDYADDVHPETGEKCKRAYKIPKEEEGDYPTVTRASLLLPYVNGR